MARVLISEARVVKTLIAAKQYLNTGKVKDKKVTTICHALAVALGHNKISFIEKKAVQSLISFRLGDSLTVIGWLNKQNIFGTHKQYQQHRHAWVDKLIEEFSNGNQNTKAT